MEAAGKAAVRTVSPVNHGMNPHKVRPARIRGIEMFQFLPVRICPPSSNEYRFYPRPFGQICLQPFLHGKGVAFDIEVVFGGRCLYEFVHLGEGVRRDNVDGLELLGECLVVFRRVAVREPRGGRWVSSRNGGEDDDKEYETCKSRSSSAIDRASRGGRKVRSRGIVAGRRAQSLHESS